MYRVNGELPNYSADLYKLKNGDRVEWLYTHDLGADIGEKFENPTPNPNSSGNSAGGSGSSDKPAETEKPIEETNLENAVVNIETKNGEEKAIISSETLTEKMKDTAVIKLVVKDETGISLEILKETLNQTKLTEKYGDYNLVITAKSLKVYGKKAVSRNIGVETADGKKEQLQTAQEYIQVTIPSTGVTKDTVVLRYENGEYFAVPHKVVNGKLVLQTKQEWYIRCK